MRYLSAILLAAIVPVAAAADTLSYNFTATLQSQIIYGDPGTSDTDAPPLAGAFSHLAVGDEVTGAVHLTYEAEKGGGSSPVMWRVRGTCDLGDVDCGFGGETVFNDPTTAASLRDTGEGSFMLTDFRDATMFEFSPIGSAVTYMGTALDSFLPYEAKFGISSLRITGPSDPMTLVAAPVRLAVVPLPAGLPMLLGGFALLAFLRRRRTT